MIVFSLDEDHALTLKRHETSIPEITLYCLEEILYKLKKAKALLLFDSRINSFIKTDRTNDIKAVHLYALDYLNSSIKLYKE
jgi:hypothetical protein